MCDSFIRFMHKDNSLGMQLPTKNESEWKYWYRRPQFEILHETS